MKDEQLQLPLPDTQVEMTFNLDEVPEPPDPVLGNIRYLGALELAAHGYRVHPLNDRKAILVDWPNLATTDPATIWKWWHEYPDANIGIGTGWTVFILDIDPKNGGHISLAELEAKYGKLPNTLRVRTPSGGTHYYFLYPPNLKITNSTSAIAPGIDIRGWHGLAVAPPSVRLATGAPYTWDVPTGVDWWDVVVAPCPLWLRSLILKAKAGRSGKVKAFRNLKAGEIVPEGSRHEAMLAYAMGLRKMGGDSVSILPKLLAWVDEHCPGAALAHSIQMAQSMMNYQTLDEEAEDKKEKANSTFVEADEEVGADDGPDLDYIDKLDRGEKGTSILHTIKNVHLILKTSPLWHRGIAFDEFYNRAKITRDIGAELLREGQEIGDAQITKTRLILNQKVGEDFGKMLVYEAMLAVAHDRTFHPVRDYLNGLIWDGTPRVGHWLTTYLGAEANDYTSAVGQAFLVSAVARVMQPGCEIDGALVLEGTQGLGKSAAVKALMAKPEWIGTLKADLARPDTLLNLHGQWFVELQEMVHARKSEVDELKGFLTETADRVRSPYGILDKRYPRQSVFFGGTNNDCYLKDVTGNRRFWPVACSDVITNRDGSFVDRDGLVRDRDQIWAEVYQMFQDGVSWKLTSIVKKLAKEEQEERVLPEPWFDSIASFLASDEMAKVGEISLAMLLQTVDKPLAGVTAFDYARLADIVKKLGWTLIKPRKKQADGTRPRMYKRPVR
jgi:predicted P-loop ATPase